MKALESAAGDAHDCHSRHAGAVRVLDGMAEARFDAVPEAAADMARKRPLPWFLACRAREPGFPRQLGCLPSTVRLRQENPAQAGESKLLRRCSKLISQSEETKVESPLLGEGNLP